MTSNAIGMRKIGRVAAEIRDDIRAGTLEPEQKLPNDRELAERYDVAVGTVREAVRLLQEEGWVVITPSVGKFVTGERPDEGPTLDVLGQRVKDLEATVSELRVRVDELESGSSDASGG